MSGMRQKARPCPGSPLQAQAQEPGVLGLAPSPPPKTLVRHFLFWGLCFLVVTLWDCDGHIFPSVESFY